MKSGWLNFVVSVPLIALFGGAGVMAFFVAQTWQPRHNDAVIIALSLSCLAMVAIIAVSVTLFMMYAYRYRMENRYQETGPQIRALPPARPPSWAEQPPQIEDKHAGSWQTAHGGYDLWEESEQQNSGEWRR